MSDQHTVQDWRAYFQSLGPGTPHDPSRYERLPPRPRIVFENVKTYALDYIDVEKTDMLNRAMEVWEQHKGKSRMWMFYYVGESPWFYG